MIRVRPFELQDADDWDDFCDAAVNATLLHTRRYLAYHGDRFHDESQILEDDKGRIVGLFPAARDPGDDNCVVSHPGITYGGLLHAGRLEGSRMMQSLGALAGNYADNGFTRLLYKPVPHIYHCTPAQDDLYALFRQGARRCRCDLSATLNLQNRLPKSERRRRGLRKAQKMGVAVREGGGNIEPLWQVLRYNLKRKHDVKPVHDEAEIRLLAEHFPKQIQFFTGWFDDELVAGVVLFVAGPAYHAQYIAASERGQELNALDCVFEACIARATETGARWFDFGICNEKQGWLLNDGLYRFKREFGGGGTVHEFYMLDLNDN